MAIVNTYKDQFRIFSFDEDSSRSQLISELFRSQGYNFSTFSDQESFMELIETQMPHIFILYYQPLNMKFREMLSKMRGLSSEVEIILLGSNDFWPGIRNLMNTGLVNDFWSWPVASKEVLQVRVDKVIERTIFKYIAEQRSDETQKIVEALESLGQKEDAFKASSPEVVDAFSLSTEAKTEARLVEDLVETLKDNHPKSDFIYVKNYQAKDQLLVTRTSFSKEAYYRGQSLPMPQSLLEEDKDKGFSQTRALLEENFAIEDFQLQVVEFSGQIFGFILAIHFSENMDKYLQRAARYISLALRNLQLESGTVPVDMSVNDVQISSQSLLIELSKEVSRARRIHQPLSLVKAHIEYSAEDDSEKREISRLFVDHLRSYDFVTQTSENEFMIVLPHCDYESAAIKAERFRRMILNRGMKTQNTPLRLCFGVTEYPRLSPDTDQMLQDVDQACLQVLASGNNKVCLYTAPSDYEPEFVFNMNERVEI